MLAALSHDFSPFLIQFTESFGIRYYGVAYLLGFIGGAWLMTRYSRTGRTPLSVERVWDLLFYLVIGVMVGGRLGYFLLYTPGAFLADPLSLLLIWKGGMASHGGMAGVAVAIWFFARRSRTPFLHLSDIVTSVAPLGLLLGRLANFINGELWGKPANVPWAFLFPDSPLPLVARHPSQLYQAALEGALLLAWLQWRAWRTPVLGTQPGRLAGEFLLGYAVLRAIGEHFREPDAALILGLSRGTFYSLFFAAAGLALIVFATRRGRPPMPPPAPTSRELAR